MFSNIGWGEMAILVIAALVILGPERLPHAMSWVAKTLKQVREYATGAQSQLKDELGPEFEDLKKPFDELRSMRGMTPRGVITKHLLDGDDSYFTGNFDSTPASSGPAQTAGSHNGALPGSASGGTLPGSASGGTLPGSASGGTLPSSAPGGAGQSSLGPAGPGPTPPGQEPGPTRYDSEAT